MVLVNSLSQVVNSLGDRAQSALIQGLVYGLVKWHDVGLPPALMRSMDPTWNFLDPTEIFTDSDVLLDRFKELDLNTFRRTP
jgi:hypothetical protein